MGGVDRTIPCHCHRSSRFWSYEDDRHDMSPKAQGDHLAAIFDGLDLNDVHVVGPDVGMGAALAYAIHHEHRLSSIVIGHGFGAPGPFLAFTTKLEGIRHQSNTSNATHPSKALPNSKIQILLEAGHLSWSDQPELFSSMIIDWVNAPRKTYVCLNDGIVKGTYFIKTNQSRPRKPCM